MSCSRGKASPDDQTKLRLFADSGGFCQRPACNRPLFVDLKTERIHIAEMAHIIAASDDGPRADRLRSAEERGAYDNLILLCPSCHSEIDKAPKTYTDSIVSKWKREHVNRLLNVFGITTHESRSALRASVSPILEANRSIFEVYGPNNDYQYDPESHQAETWKRKVVSVILPNNYKLLAMLDANRKWLSPEERSVVELFRQHIDDLASRHMDTDMAGGGRKFPVEMSMIAESEGGK